MPVSLYLELEQIHSLHLHLPIIKELRIFSVLWGHQEESGSFLYNDLETISAFFLPQSNYTLYMVLLRAWAGMG